MVDPGNYTTRGDVNALACSRAQANGAVSTRQLNPDGLTKGIPKSIADPADRVDVAVKPQYVGCGVRLALSRLSDPPNQGPGTHPQVDGGSMVAGHGD